MFGKKRGKLGSVISRKPNKKAFIMHEMWMLIFQLLIVFMFTVSLFQYINSISTNTDFERRFTAIDVALMTTTAFYAPGILTQEYTPAPLRIPLRLSFQNSIINVRQQGTEIGGKMYWYLSNRNMEPLASEITLEQTENNETPEYLDQTIEQSTQEDNTITFYKAGRQITFTKQDNNALQQTCPAIETKEAFWETKKIFIAKVLPQEEYNNPENPVNQIANLLNARYPNFEKSGEQTQIQDNTVISAIPSDADIIIALGDSGQNREDGSLITYISLDNSKEQETTQSNQNAELKNNITQKERKLACFVLNDILTPQTTVFYSQIMPIITERLEETSPLKVFDEKPNQQQIMIFIDISKFTEEQIFEEEISEAIHRAVARYYGAYELSQINAPTISFLVDPQQFYTTETTNIQAGTQTPANNIEGTGSTPFQRMRSVCSTSSIGLEEGLRKLKDVTAYWVREGQNNGAYYVRWGRTSSSGECSGSGQPAWITNQLQEMFPSDPLPSTCDPNTKSYSDECVEDLRSMYNEKIVHDLSNHYICGDCGTYLVQLYRCALGETQEFKTKPINAPIIIATTGAIRGYAREYVAIFDETTAPNGRRQFGDNPETCWDVLTRAPGGLQFGDIIELPGHWVMYTGGAGLDYELLEMGAYAFPPAAGLKRSTGSFKGQPIHGLRTVQSAQTALSSSNVRGCALRRISNEAAQYSGVQTT